MNHLHVYARLLRCKSLAWEIIAIVAFDRGHERTACGAFSRSLEASDCSGIVLGRAGALSAAQGPTDQRHLHPSSGSDL